MKIKTIKEYRIYVIESSCKTEGFAKHRVAELKANNKDAVYITVFEDQ